MVLIPAGILTVENSFKTSFSSPKLLRKIKVERFSTEIPEARSCICALIGVIKSDIREDLGEDALGRSMTVRSW